MVDAPSTMTAPAEVSWDLWQRVYPAGAPPALRAQHHGVIDQLESVHAAAMGDDPIAMTALGCWWRTIWTETGLNSPAQAWLMRQLGEPSRWLMRADRAWFLPGVVRAMTQAADLEPGRWRMPDRAEIERATGCVALPMLAPTDALQPVRDVLALDPADPASWWSLTGGYPTVCGFWPEPGTTWRLFAGPLGWLRAGMPEDGGAILDLDEAVRDFGEWALVRTTDMVTGQAYVDRRAALLRPRRPTLPSLFAEIDEQAAA